MTPKITLTAENILRIAAWPDAEVRNHKVTAAYWQLSQEIDRVLHRENQPSTERNANWFTIATWAISTVGRNIRANELPRRLDRALPSTIRSRAEPWVLSMRSSGGQRVARALGHGQIVVFTTAAMKALELLHDIATDDIAETRRWLSRLGAARKNLNDDERTYLVKLLSQIPCATPELETLISKLSNGSVTALDSVRRELTSFNRTLPFANANIDRQLIDRLVALSPDEFAHLFVNTNLSAKSARRWLHLVSEAFAGGHRGLIDDLDAAFAAYQRAIISPDADATAKEIYRANIMISAVEQVLLDPAIRTVVEHVPREFESWMQGSASQWAERTFQIPSWLGRLGIERRLRHPQLLARESWARALTDQVLVIALPAQTIRIGRDIPMPTWDDEFYPLALAALDDVPPDPSHPTSEADVLSTNQIFDLFDRSHGDGRGTAANDWRRYDERMNFAVNLLRSRQQDTTLFWQPYNDEDLKRIQDGEVPIRTADPFEHQVVVPSSWDGGPR